MIIVLDQERVYNDLVRDMPKFVKVVWQPKSGGVVSRNQEQRAESRDARVKQYFYGPHNNLFPHSFEVRLLSLWLSSHLSISRSVLVRSRTSSSRLELLSCLTAVFLLA